MARQRRRAAAAAAAGGPLFTRQGIALGALALVGALGLHVASTRCGPKNARSSCSWAKFSAIGNPGLNFAPWPLVTDEMVQVTGERTTDIGTGRERRRGQRA